MSDKEDECNASTDGMSLSSFMPSNKSERKKAYSVGISGYFCCIKNTVRTNELAKHRTVINLSGGMTIFLIRDQELHDNIEQPARCFAHSGRFDANCSLSGCSS